jgi:hypothetical protein
MMSKNIYILNESQIKTVIKQLLKEDGGDKILKVINLDAIWPMGKYKLTSEQTAKIDKELYDLLEILKSNTESKIKIQIEAGESRVTNFDKEEPPYKELDPGVLSKKRGDGLRKYLYRFFKNQIGKSINEKQMPKIPEAKNIIGATEYTDKNDLKNQEKLKKYQSEQFVRAIISAISVPACSIGMKIVIGYYPNRNRSKHVCDEAIFELKMNGVSIGEVNLNNGILDEWTEEKLEQVKSTGARGLTDENIITAARKKQMNPFEFSNQIIAINKAFKNYKRISDNRVGGTRYQQFTIDENKAKQILQNADTITISIVPLVSQESKYKIFYEKGSHSEAPMVTIIGNNNKVIYNGEPNIKLKRGSTEETVLLATDSCGKPINR